MAAGDRRASPGPLRRGADKASNIVAACRFCNSRPHQTPRPLPPRDYACKVQRRLATGKWHGLRLHGEARASPALHPAGPELREIAGADASCR